MLLNKFCSLGGFYRSKIISEKRITHFVPFLPLCRRHVERCAQRELCQRGECQRRDVAVAVGGAMSYTPQDGQHFSSTGCKLVPAKVNLFLWAMGVIRADIRGTSDQSVFICASVQEQVFAFVKTLVLHEQAQKISFEDWSWDTFTGANADYQEINQYKDAGKGPCRRELPLWNGKYFHSCSVHTKHTAVPLLIIVREQMCRAAVSWLVRFVQLNRSNLSDCRNFSWLGTTFLSVIYKLDTLVSLISDDIQGTLYRFKVRTHLSSIIYLLFYYFFSLFLEKIATTKKMLWFYMFCVYGWHVQYFRIQFKNYTRPLVVCSFSYTHVNVFRISNIFSY